MRQIFPLTHKLLPSLIFGIQLIIDPIAMFEEDQIDAHHQKVECKLDEVIEHDEVPGSKFVTNLILLNI